MDQNNQPLESINENQPIVPMAEHKKTGPMIGILVIILIVVIATLYLFASRTEAPVIPDDGDSLTQVQTTSEVQPVTNLSDDVLDLQTDLNASVQGLDGQNF